MCFTPIKVLYYKACILHQRFPLGKHSAPSQSNTCTHTFCLWALKIMWQYKMYLFTITFHWKGHMCVDFFLCL